MGWLSEKRIWALIESFLYGVYASLVFCPIYNAFCRRWAQADSGRRAL